MYLVQIIKYETILRLNFFFVFFASLVKLSKSTYAKNRNDDETSSKSDSPSSRYTSVYI